MYANCDQDACCGRRCPRRVCSHLHTPYRYPRAAPRLRDWSRDIPDFRSALTVKGRNSGNRVQGGIGLGCKVFMRQNPCTPAHGYALPSLQEMNEIPRVSKRQELRSVGLWARTTSEPFLLRRWREAQWRPTVLSGARDTEHIGRWMRDFLACSQSRARFQRCVKLLVLRAGHIARLDYASISVTVLVENQRLGYFVTGAPRAALVFTFVLLPQMGSVQASSAGAPHEWNRRENSSRKTRCRTAVSGTDGRSAMEACENAAAEEGWPYLTC